MSNRKGYLKTFNQCRPRLAAKSEAWFGSALLDKDKNPYILNPLPHASSAKFDQTLFCMHFAVVDLDLY